MTRAHQRCAELFIRGNESHGQFSQRNSAFTLERMQPGELLVGVLAEIRAFTPPFRGERINESEYARDNQSHALGFRGGEHIPARGDIERCVIKATSTESIPSSSRTSRPMWRALLPAMPM